MDFEFTSLSGSVLAAYKAYQKTEDLISRKRDLLNQIFEYHCIEPKSILYLGFDPWILADWSGKDIYVGLITDEVEQYLIDFGVKFTRVDDNLDNFCYDAVIAGDEFLTYSTSEEDQINRINLISDLSSQVVITTLRDYKNISMREREFCLPTAIKNDKYHSVFLEYHNYDYGVKNHWISNIFENGHNNRVYGPYQRRPMFFKQFAKFSYDAGASGFTVHPQLMFKGLCKKNYEHVLSVKFN